MDFLLTPSGDVTFEVYEKDSSPLEVSFVTSNTTALSVSFYAENNNNNKAESQSSISIGFYVDNPSFNKTITTTSKENLKEQQIRIRLQTVIGDMGSDPSIGSYIEKYKHEFIDT